MEWMDGLFCHDFPLLRVSRITEIEMKRDRVYLCLAHMSGQEQKFIKEAFDTNWGCRWGRMSMGSRPTSNGSSIVARVPNRRIKRSSVCRRGRRRYIWRCWPAASGRAMRCWCNRLHSVASSHPVTYLGATPVFVDSERETWNLDPDLLEAAIADRIAKTGRKPKAIVPVALYGMPYRIDRIVEIADRYGIPVIEDAAEGLGSRFDGRVLGTFGRYGVLSFNGNKMITTSGGGALICGDEEAKKEILFYATQARESYPYYQHEHIGYNYRMSNICAGIGRGQMTVIDAHIAHHRHVQALYRELFKGVRGITLHESPSQRYDSNFWLCAITLDPSLRVKGQDDAYRRIITGAIGGAAGVTHAAATPHTDCEPNANVEAMRIALDAANIEARPTWKPMHKQPVYKNNPAYINGVSEAVFKTGMCLPAGPYVTDEDVHYIVDAIKANIE